MMTKNKDNKKTSPKDKEMHKNRNYDHTTQKTLTAIMTTTNHKI